MSARTASRLWRALEKQLTPRRRRWASFAVLMVLAMLGLIALSNLLSSTDRAPFSAAGADELEEMYGLEVDLPYCAYTLNHDFGRETLHARCIASLDTARQLATARGLQLDPKVRRHEVIAAPAASDALWPPNPTGSVRAWQREERRPGGSVWLHEDVVWSEGNLWWRFATD